MTQCRGNHQLADSRNDMNMLVAIDKIRGIAGRRAKCCELPVDFCREFAKIKAPGEGAGEQTVRSRQPSVGPCAGHRPQRPFASQHEVKTDLNLFAPFRRGGAKPGKHRRIVRPAFGGSHAAYGIDASGLCQFGDDPAGSPGHGKIVGTKYD